MKQGDQCTIVVRCHDDQLEPKFETIGTGVVVGYFSDRRHIVRMVWKEHHTPEMFPISGEPCKFLFAAQFLVVEPELLTNPTRTVGVVEVDNMVNLDGQ